MERDKQSIDGNNEVYYLLSCRNRDSPRSMSRKGAVGRMIEVTSAKVQDNRQGGGSSVSLSLVGRDDQNGRSSGCSLTMAHAQLLMDHYGVDSLEGLVGTKSQMTGPMARMDSGIQEIIREVAQQRKLRISSLQLLEYIAVCLSFGKLPDFSDVDGDSVRAAMEQSFATREAIVAWCVQLGERILTLSDGEAHLRSTVLDDRNIASLVLKRGSAKEERYEVSRSASVISKQYI